MVAEGDPAPTFELDSTAGGTQRLEDSLTTGPTAIVVFRGYWCSYCAEQLQTFSNLAYDLWRHFDTDVLPITGDPVPDLVEMRDRFELTVQLLSDPDLDVTPAYTGIEDHPTYGPIPVPGTFIVDTDGIVQYAHVAEHTADRTYANLVRHTIKGGFDGEGYSPSRLP